jgi:hypothetical protein
LKKVVAAGVFLAAFSFVPAAMASTPTRAHVRQYLRTYMQVRQKFGIRAPGCNLISHRGSCHQKASDGDIETSLSILHRMLAPPPQPSTTPATASQTSDTTVSAVQHTTLAIASASPSAVSGASSGGGSGAVPSCASESGSDYSTGPDNTNPSSGATGRYQIIPSTAAAYGCNLSTPAGQDACASVIYQHQGAGAWVGCGG